MLPFDLRAKEFVGIIVPSPQTSVGDAGGSLLSSLVGTASAVATRSFTNYMQAVPLLFNTSFDPDLKGKSNILSTLDSTFTNAFKSIKTSGVSLGNSLLSSAFKNGVTFPTSPIDFEGGGCRYLVHIPELMPFIEATDGIWCYSGIPNTQANKNGANDKSNTLSGLVTDAIGKIFNVANTVTNLLDTFDDTVKTWEDAFDSTYSNDSRVIDNSNSLNDIYSAVAALGILESFNDLANTLKQNPDIHSSVSHICEQLGALGSLGKSIQDDRTSDISHLNQLLYNAKQADIEGIFNQIPSSIDTSYLRSKVNNNVLNNMYKTFEGIDSTKLSTASQLSSFGGWGVDFDASDVVEKTAEIVGNTKSGALGFISGSFLNFTLNSGAEMSSKKEDSIAGDYKPITTGTKVVIRFSENDLNTGQILRVLPHDSQNGPQYKNYKTTNDDLEDLYPGLYQK